MNLIKPFFSKLSFSLVLVLLFVGCISFTQKITYTPTKNRTKNFDSRIGKIYIFPFEDKLETPTTIKFIQGAFSDLAHESDTPLKNVVYQGIWQEFQQSGLILTDNVEESSGYIKGTLTIFETYMTPGHVLSNRAELDISLYSSQTQKTIWKESIEAISKATAEANGDGDLYNYNIIKLVHRVVDNPDFYDAIISLSKK